MKKLKKKQLLALQANQISRELNNAYTTETKHVAIKKAAKLATKLQYRKLEDSNWFLPVTTNVDSDDEINKSLSRYQFASINSKKHYHNRLILKQAYKNRETITWCGIVSDISYPTKSNPYGSLLITHVFKYEKLSNYIMIKPKEARKEIIDYHCWVSLNKICKLPHDHQAISVGEMIIGTSIVDKYQNAKGKTKYGLGVTNINHVGVYTTNGQSLVTIKGIMGTISRNIEPISEFHRKRPIVRLDYKLIHNDVKSTYVDLLLYNHSFDAITSPRYYKRKHSRYYKNFSSTHTSGYNSLYQLNYSDYYHKYFEKESNGQKALDIKYGFNDHVMAVFDCKDIDNAITKKQ